VRWKRALIAAGIAMIAAAALILAWHPTFPLVVAAELLHGATAGLITPAVARAWARSRARWATAASSS
jgi:hypothetical protein